MYRKKELETILKDFKKAYLFLYDFCDQCQEIENKYIQLFDTFCENKNEKFINFLDQFTEYRKDIITSDREAASIMLALEKNNINF